MSSLVSIGVAANEMGVHPDTLRRWEREGKIEPVERTPGGRRRYDLSKLRHLAPHKAPSSRTTIAYARVSTSGQMTTVSGFSHGREHLMVAMLVDTSDHEARLAAFKEGRPFGQASMPALNEPRPRLRAPITVRLYFSEDKQSWYAGATTERVGAPGPMEHLPGALGMDTNPDHLAWCLVDTQGNPTRWGKIPLALNGKRDHDAAAIGEAVKELVALAKSCRVVLVTEKLDFARKRAELRYLPRKLARLLSSFAYSKILTGVHARCIEEGVHHVSVNPAWTSALGQANYAVPHGVSVDQAAACVIARRGLGLSTRVRPQVARWMRPVDRSGPRACSRADVSLRALAGAPEEESHLGCRLARSKA